MNYEHYKKVCIGIIGRTESGKSTFLNAMCNEMVAPECCLRGLRETVQLTYVMKKPALFSPNDVSFISEKTKWEDKKRISYANSNILNNAIFIEIEDRCGSQYMESVIKQQKCDLLIYICGSFPLTTNELSFLQCSILGYCPTDREIKRMRCEVGEPIIAPDRLILLGNDKCGIIRRGFVESVKRIFKSDNCKLSDGEIAEFCKQNVWIANALLARLSSAGVYDYVGRATIEIDDYLADDLRDLNRRQRRYLAEIEDREQDARSDVEKWNKFIHYLNKKITEIYLEKQKRGGYWNENE